VTSNNSEVRDSTSSQATTVSLDLQNINKDKLPLAKTRIQPENSQLKVNKIFSKQSLKSRLTICQLILLILNIVGILTFILLIVFFAKSKNSLSGIFIKINKKTLFFSLFIDILLIKTGNFYGNVAGGNSFNDAQNCSLNFEDKIVGVNAGWDPDTLEYIMFYYSNGKSEQHGRQTSDYSPYTSTFYLEPGENINGVTVYTGTRLIDNPYAPNGSFLVVGLRFYTDQGHTSDLFGSSNGTQVYEIFPWFIIGYVRGQALGYVDALQFIWYNKSPPTNNALLLTY
jgi:hypothetical protein